jgi:DNA polymerase I-like protein with 3'-5' exonuclease and polymerase domains
VNWREEECLQRLSEERFIVADVETSGLDWRRNHAVGYVFTFGEAPEDSYYLPVRHTGGGNIGTESIPDSAQGWSGARHSIERRINKALALNGGLQWVVGHNLAFDLKFLAKHGIEIPPWTQTGDTQINEALIDEFAKSFSLENCALRARVPAKLGKELYSYLASQFGGEAKQKQMGNYWKTNAEVPIVYEYAAGDGTTTWHLWFHQMNRIEEQDLGKVHEVECRVIRTLHRITWRGVKINQGRLEELFEITGNKLETAQNALPSGFNVRSGKDVRGLFANAGITNWPLTEKGNPSFPEAWLEKTDQGKLIIAVRKLSNLQNSFMKPMRETHLYLGRVHANYNQLRSDDLGTITGRLSSSSPNLQQVVKRNKELGRLFRSIFIPDDGMVWGSTDYSQCEPRLLAYYGRVKLLLDGYRADPPIDAHSAVNEAAGLGDREMAKRLNQALITGAGEKKTCEMMGLSEEDGIPIVRQFFKNMPEIKVVQRRAMRRMESEGFVRSLLGRKSRNEPGGRFAYKALNRLLQCGNADIIKSKMAEVDDFLVENDDKVHILNNVHDSIDYQFFEDDRKIYEEAIRIMEQFGDDDLIPLDVPMVVEAGEGPNWAIATYGEEE